LPGASKIAAAALIASTAATLAYVITVVVQVRPYLTPAMLRRDLL
jgi:hypothetical protein